MMSLATSLACLLLMASVPLRGTVVDTEGRPVGGARVWLGDTNAKREGPETIDSGVTDGKGRFTLQRPAELTGRGSSWSPTLWAFKSGSRIAFVEFKAKLPAADEEVRLVLGPPASASVRVAQPDGKPARGVEVLPARLKLEAPNPPDAMVERMSVKTDADGRAVIDGLNRADFDVLDVTPPGQIVQCLPVEEGTDLLTIRGVGRVHVTIVADDPKAIKGWRVTGDSHPTELDHKVPYYTHWSRETTGDDGRVVFPGLADGLIHWTITPPAGSDYLIVKNEATRLRAGETVDVTFQIQRGIRVEGVVLEDPSGKPIAGIKVDIDPLRSRSGHRIQGLPTDAQGRFSAVVPPGPQRFSYSPFEKSKDYYLPPNIQHWDDFEAQAQPDRQEYKPPRLRKAARVRGKVVDEAGQPVAGVRVNGLWNLPEFGQTNDYASEITDSHGEFELGGIAPKAFVSVTASAGPQAESDAEIVSLAGEGPPVTLKLRSRPTVAISGRVVSEDGKPLAGATIKIHVRPLDQRGPNTGDPIAFPDKAVVRTTPDGRFQTPKGLPIGSEYRVEAEAPNHELARSKWFAEPDLIVPDLKLRSAIGTREMTGRVVDSNGHPVEGVEVDQSGDGPRITRGLTDADGRFLVKGVPDAPAFLFASKRGYRFLGVLVRQGQHTADFSIRKLEEPPAVRLSLVPHPLSRDEERKIARGLLEEARSVPDSGPGISNQHSIPEIAALVESDRVQEIVNGQALRGQTAVIAALAIRRFEDDPRKVLEILGTIEDSTDAAFVAITLFDKLGSNATPEFRREILSRSAARAREIEAPGVTVQALATLATRCFDIGENDLGTKLTFEALGQTKVENKPGHANLDPGQYLIPPLSRVNLRAALAMLDEHANEQAYYLNLIRSNVASQVAPTNPAEARRIIGLITEDSRPNAWRDASLTLAATDLPTARLFAAESQSPLVLAVLPAITAKALEKKDPEAARKLLLEAVEALEKVEDSEWAPSTSVALARLIPLATRIDPDRAPGYLWLAISKRRALPAMPEPIPIMPQTRQHYLDLAELAVRVGRYDRASAKAIFAPVARRLVGMNDEYWGLGAEGPALFRVAGAFDATIARTLLNQLADDPTPPEPGQNNGGNFLHHSKAEARIALARSLGLPPALRLIEPMVSHSWLNAIGD